jgi:hypothetical protein
MGRFGYSDNRLVKNHLRFEGWIDGDGFFALQSQNKIKGLRRLSAVSVI